MYKEIGCLRNKKQKTHTLLETTALAFTLIRISVDTVTTTFTIFSTILSVNVQINTEDMLRHK